MAEFERYAVYWAPAPGTAMEALAAGWLARDPGIGPLPRPWPALTEAPRRYGLHATLKAPFRLAPGVGRATLEARVGALAARLAPAEAPGLRLSTAMGFGALVPAGPAPGIDALAAEAVTALDDLRAPPTEAEIARRAPERLDPAERAHLARWGYPYVLDRFRFHITLTGPIAPAEAAALEAALRPLVSPALAAPFRIDALTLFGDPGGTAPFVRLNDHALAAPAHAPTR